MREKARWLGRALLPLLLLAPAACASLHERRSEPSAVQEKPITSTLPLIVVDADRSIDGPTHAQLQIVEGASEGPTSLGAAPVTFSGDITIQIRGSSSRRCPKKQYALFLGGRSGPKKQAALLGMPAAAEWILQGPCLDRSLIRNPLAYDLSNRIGRYAVRTRFVEAFLREGGAKDPSSHYAGVFVLMEKIARGPERVNVSKVSDSDPSGGYILKIDKGNDAHLVTARGTRIAYVEPGHPTPIQEGYLKKFFEDLEACLAGQHFNDPKDGYARYLDVDSFVDHYLLNELMRNVDALRLSAYMSKDRGGKLAMGPIWDFDRSAGIGFLKSPEGWFLPRRFRNYDPPFWWGRMLEDPAFRQRLARRWVALRGDALSDASLAAVVDGMVARLGDAPKRNFEVWPFLGVKTGVFDLDPVASPTYEGEIEELKTFLIARARWMDGNLDSLGKKEKTEGVRAQGSPVRGGDAGSPRTAARATAPGSGGGIFRAGARGARHDAQSKQNDAGDRDVELGDAGDRQGPGDAGDQDHESGDVNKECHKRLLLSTARSSRSLDRQA